MRFPTLFTTGLIIIFTASAISINSQAGQGSSHGPPSFSDFDQDGNGFISEDEFNTHRAERMAARAAEGKEMRGAATAPSFSDIDVDGDGQLNPEELSTAQKSHMKKHKEMGKGHGGGEGKHAGKGKGMKGHMPSFSDFDLNGDGVISEAEFNEGHAKRMSEMAEEGRQMKHAGDAPGFSGIDTDENGEISKDEFATHQAEHHSKMKHGEHQ